MVFQQSISKEDINKLPRFTFEGRIEVVENDEDALRAVKDLKEYQVLGFDTETRAAFRKGERYQVSLLQLATGTAVYLFRLNKLSVYGEIFSLLADPNIVKAGVAVEGDTKALQKKSSFKPENFVDLAMMAKERNIENFGLRALTAIVLGKRLSKNAKVSNWDREILTEAQIHYAACDGAVGYEIYCRFIEDQEVIGAN